MDEPRACGHCLPGPDGKPISTDPAFMCKHVAYNTYKITDDMPGPPDPMETGRAADDETLVLSSPSRLAPGAPCWFRSGDTMPWMPGVFEGMDAETGDAIVLALEQNLKTRRWRFGPRIRPIGTPDNSLGTPPQKVSGPDSIKVSPQLDERLVRYGTLTEAARRVVSVTERGARERAIDALSDALRRVDALDTYR